MLDGREFKIENCNSASSFKLSNTNDSFGIVN
jgi:hypothetical protein